MKQVLEIENSDNMLCPNSDTRIWNIVNNKDKEKDIWKSNYQSLGNKMLQEHFESTMDS